LEVELVRDIGIVGLLRKYLSSGEWVLVCGDFLCITTLVYRAKAQALILSSDGVEALALARRSKHLDREIKRLLMLKQNMLDRLLAVKVERKRGALCEGEAYLINKGIPREEVIEDLVKCVGGECEVRLRGVDTNPPA